MSHEEQGIVSVSSSQLRGGSVVSSCMETTLLCFQVRVAVCVFMNTADERKLWKNSSQMIQKVHCINKKWKCDSRGHK